ncbi:CoA-binding protein [Denitratisoma sp. DHT3]|uniref:CoA-binding protein n=1 Tax=Denitratisoma sp. DHT3 TaxID=1981880 RepID=UPI0011986CF5|nr:CoA-binding protein [Denitratisoma sp. DHT3]QDX82374.1 CoA-binding protein [Denitratisoma sp. DHT3]
MFANPNEDEIRHLLRTVKTVAVVGFSPQPDRPSHRVALALRLAGYRVIPVRPGLDEGLGEKAYASVRDLPEVPDVVDVFRAPDAVDAIVDECIARGVTRLWLQDGVINEAAAERARAAGLTVVMDRCMLRDQGLLA